MTPDLFGERPKTRRRVMMHAADQGHAPALMPGWRTANGGLFECSRCGHSTGWLFDMQDSEVRRGIPCPICNQEG